jgi:outer membrane immunogenic protein
MRRIAMACIAVVALAAPGAAQDAFERFPTGLEPGEPVYWNWGGFYVGGHIGARSTNIDPGHASSPMLRELAVATGLTEAQLRQLTALSGSSRQGPSYGAFAGFNQQWEDVVLGVELTYNRARIAGDFAGTAYFPSFAAPTFVAANQTSIRVDDYGSLRGRAGYVLDRFLPYVAIGIALGRADIRRTTTLTSGFGTVTASDGKSNAVIAGLSAGFGLDVAITPHIFARAEYEYVYFGLSADTRLTNHAGRLGLGLKF